MTKTFRMTTRQYSIDPKKADVWVDQEQYH